VFGANFLTDSTYATVELMVR